MQNTIKPILSIAAMALFVLMTAACLGPDYASNIFVKIGNCEAKPPINVKAKVNVLIIDNNGQPVQAGEGTLFVSNNIVKDDTCEYAASGFYQSNVVIGIDGKYSYTTPSVQHKNTQDLFRVELVFRLAGRESRTTKVLRYDETECSFTLKAPEPEYP